MPIFLGNLRMFHMVAHLKVMWLCPPNLPLNTHRDREAPRVTRVRSIRYSIDQGNKNYNTPATPREGLMGPALSEVEQNR
jgi:hypothetical protein